MPRWQRAFHTFACWFMCVAFGGLFVLSLRIFLPGKSAAPNRGQIAASVVMMAVSILAIALQFRFRRRMIKEFSYDGRALRFSTLGSPLQEVRDLSEIEKLSEWQGRGGTQGYKIRLRGGKTVYLSNAVTNSREVAVRIWKDLGN